MKILLVNTRHRRGGGDSTYTFNLAELLRHHGHEVAFFAMQDPQNLPDENADLFVSHIDFRELNRKKSILSGARVVARAIYSQEARSKFSQLLDRIRPDLIHLQNIHNHLTPSVIMEARARCLPVVWTLHDFKVVCPNTHFIIDSTNHICEACNGGHFYQAALKRCKKGSLLASTVASIEAYSHQALQVRKMVSAYLTPSHFLRDKLVSNGYSPEQVHHVPNFLSPEWIKQASANNGADGNYILFLGKLDPFKGIFQLLEASRSVPQVRVVVAGRAEESLEAQLAALMPSNVHYAGVVVGSALQDLLRQARAVVLPSLWYENQPFSILEAFAYGKPVIATRLGGNAELVTHQERGLLVAPGHVPALTESLQWMADHPAEAATMGHNARRYVVEHHSAEGHYQRVEAIYRSVSQHIPSRS